MMEMEVAVENNNLRSGRGRAASILDMDNGAENRDFQYRPPQMLKVAMIGDSTVGKTTLCEIFCKSNFNYGQNYYMTCGAEIYGKSIKQSQGSNSVSDERVNLIVVDSSGKDIYTEFLPKYWEKLDAVALVVDLTSSTSLENAVAWLELTKSCLQMPAAGTPGDKTIGVLIGNKCDMVEQRSLSLDSVKQFASANQLEYFECSARQNIGLEEPFLYLAQQWSSRNGQNTTARRESKTATNRDKSDDSRRRKK